MSSKALIQKARKHVKKEFGLPVNTRNTEVDKISTFVTGKRGYLGAIILFREEEERQILLKEERQILLKETRENERRSRKIAERRMKRAENAYLRHRESIRKNRLTFKGSKIERFLLQQQSIIYPTNYMEPIITPAPRSNKIEGLFYHLSARGNEYQYLGVSVLPFWEQKYNLSRDYNLYKEGRGKYHESFEVVSKPGWKMTTEEIYPCNTMSELWNRVEERKIEQERYKERYRN